MSRRYLLWLSFCEGALVLAVELCGTKLLSPILGSSVYVWSFMLSVTLLALGAGYFSGGYLSEKKNPEDKVSYLLMAAAFFAMLMPYISSKVFYYFGELTFIPLLAIECISVLFLPLFFLGSVSPVLIKILSEEAGAKAASKIFTISTLGGVVTGLVLSFLLIGSIGVNFSLLGFSVIVFLLAAVRVGKQALPYIGLYTGLATLIYFFSVDKSEGYEILYQKNGVLGEIKVVEFAPYDTTVSKTPSTWVFVNNISQTMYDPGAEVKYFTYNYRIKELLKDSPKGSKLLLCGMGGGSIVNVLNDENIDIDICELDERMPEIAEKYFGLKKDVNVTIDDARHFIKTSKSRYDAVILDVFKGEETPNHVLSIEGLNDLKKIIHDSTIMIVNSHGYLTGSRGDGNRAIFKTLRVAGFHVTAEFTEETEARSNLLFLCRLSLPVISNKPIPEKEFETTEPVLSDKIPRLEKLNRQAALTWRGEAKGYLLREVR